MWLEAQALIAAGYEVSVICPKGPGDPARRGRSTASGSTSTGPPRRPNGLLGFVVEFVYSWLRTAAALGRGAPRAGLRRHPGVQPAGHVLAPRPAVAASSACGSSSTTTTSTRSCSCRGSASRATLGARAQYGGLLLARAAHVPGRAPGDLDERVVPPRRARRAVAVPARAHRGGAQRPGHPADAAASVPRATGARAGTCWCTWGSWVRRTTSHVVLRVMDELVHAARPHDVRAALLGFGDTPRGPAAPSHRARARRRRRVHRPGRARARSPTTCARRASAWRPTARRRSTTRRR